MRVFESVRFRYFNGNLGVSSKTLEFLIVFANEVQKSGKNFKKSRPFQEYDKVDKIPCSDNGR